MKARLTLSFDLDIDPEAYGAETLQEACDKATVEYEGIDLLGIPAKSNPNIVVAPAE